MKLLLQCNQCGSAEEGSSHGQLMNKIKMWNHLRREHPMLAERMLKVHDLMPTNFYHEFREPFVPTGQPVAVSDIHPQWA